MNFEAVIGLEIHVEMKTKSKMFSSSANDFSSKVNENISPLDFAFPGTLPVVNKEAVRKAIRVCNALHMNIDQEVWFERKNYFYSDLPKGYQITQQFRPIGSDGYLVIDLENGEQKRINIERLHMEEDTCKQLHFRDHTLLDYNRAGVPLVEIVSRPEIKNGTEAMKYVEEIRNIVTYADVSDGKMEEGSLRCDVNISIMPCGSKKFGTKVEIKNLNSTSNIQIAIDFEIQRQTKLILKGFEVEQETRRYDDVKKETVLMRKKTDAVDYKYFTEPNIAPIALSDEFVKDAIDTCPELLRAKKARFEKQYGLNSYDIDLLLTNKAIANFYEEVAKNSKHYKLVANWINVDIMSHLNATKKGIENFEIAAKPLSILINAAGDNKI
jgi:aspartyl-tRNA(Asn)/glutamyl-tRNA(Gln) amidotransferase subunit B